MKKLGIKISEPYYRFSTFLKRRGISFNYLFVSFLVLGMMFFLGYNIYLTIQQAEKTLQAREVAQEKRDKLLQESYDLDQRLAYFESVEGKRTLAVEGYKYADPGETLYKIERENDDIIFIEEQYVEPVNLNNNVFWWKFLLGIN